MTEQVMCVTSKSDRQVTGQGLVRFRDGRCREAAPVWSIMRGKTVAEVIAICDRNGYMYEWLEGEASE